MKRFSFLAYFFALTMFVACSESNTDNGKADPQPIEVTAPANVKSFDGVERVQLSWEQDSQADIAKSIIYWNERKSYKTHTFKSTAGSGMQQESLLVENLDEGDYTFEIVNLDKDNNQSVFKSIAAHAYGDDYISELKTRPVEDMVYNEEMQEVEIHWQADWNLGIRTVVERGAQQFFVKNSAQVTYIGDIEEENEFKIYTLYCPERCIDTMKGPIVKRVFKIDEGGEGGEGNEDDEPDEDTRPLTAPANVKSKDGFKRVQLSWEQTIDSSIEKTRIIWGLTEDQAHEMPFERKEQSGTQAEEIILDLPEGEYTFSIVNLDKDGNKTEAVEVKARAYGDAFVETLATRAVNSFSYNVAGRSASLTLGAASADKGMVNTKAVYRHVTTGEQVSKTIRNSATDTSCENIGPSEQIEIFSVYRFDNCLDDIQSKSIFKTTDHLVDVKVMQFNVKNEVYTWSNRSTQIANLIKDNGIEIMGLQELYSESAYNTLLEKLGSNYAGIVYQRESSMFDTESEAIIYRKDKYTIVNSGRFWLTSTPDTAGKTSVDGYTAKYERFAIWSVLKNISYGNELCFTTAHIDNSNGASDGDNLPVMTYQVGVMVNNVQARSGSVDNSSKIVRPIIIVGDFNANPDKNPIKTMLNKGYIDTFTSAQEKSAPANGPYDRATMHDNGTRNWAAFDYVFVKGGSPTVLKHQIHEHQYGGVTMSDHLAVAVTLRYQVKAE